MEVRAPLDPTVATEKIFCHPLRWIASGDTYLMVFDFMTTSGKYGTGTDWLVEGGFPRGPEPISHDHVHYTAQFSKAIAEEIGQSLLPQIAP